ncbi:MAG: TadE/TadG family type IV pilus assembly protein [Anaerolineaceae bacterium]
MKMRRYPRGQSIIEFALIFPLLFFLISALFDLGRAVFYMSSLNTAVREGTRWAIVQPRATISTAAVADHVRQSFFDVKELANNSTITPVFVYPTGPTDTTDASITITITYSFVPITPGMAALLAGGGGIPLKAESTMLLAPVAR